MRIIAGQWRGRQLIAPPGDATRPTNARARQAAFDILMHAFWAGPDFMQTARVLDVFAGTGAFGLEALSRGARHATFIEIAAPALTALRTNIAACHAEPNTQIFKADATKPPRGTPHDLVFLDPPYGQDMIPKALSALAGQNWIVPGTIIAAEFGPQDSPVYSEVLIERRHGKARLLFWRYQIINHPV